METVLIQLTNKKAIGLLHEMEALNLIKVLDETIPENLSFSEKFAGKLPSAVADDLQNYVTASRKEWSD